MIELQNISVCYGKNIVYKNFSGVFNDGVNVVLGKSGCGKTTLLKVIASLIPHEGTCKTVGKAAVVFQQPSLAPVSAYKNVDLVLPRGDNSEKIQKYLELAEIADKSQNNVLYLSGGERQRVSLARAFAAEREILLLDEPFSNLDYGVKVRLRSTLDKMISESDGTILLFTHDIDDALALADNVFLLEGKPAELRFVVSISEPRSARSEFGEATIALKKQLQTLLLG